MAGEGEAGDDICYELIGQLIIYFARYPVNSRIVLLAYSRDYEIYLLV